MKSQKSIEQQIQDIYAEARTFFASVTRRHDYGFKILNSPPIHRAPFLFIGYQPGGGSESFAYETGRQSHLTWPTESEYANATWDLARHMRDLFQPAVDLTECVGLNAIFLRSPKIAEYQKDLDRRTRDEVQRFCLERVLRIVDILDPSKVVAIGFSTLALFGETAVGIQNPKGRALTRIGKIGSREATSMLHLSGARISRDDRQRIRSAVLAG